MNPSLQPADYLAVEAVFNLLSIYRRNPSASLKSAGASLRKRGWRSLQGLAASAAQTVPGLNFWLRLAQSAALIDDGPCPTPTLLVEDWLGWPVWAQMNLLLQAWLREPQLEKLRRGRENLIERLQQKIAITATQRLDLVSLQELGICKGTSLSGLGSALVDGSNREAFLGLPRHPWTWNGGLLAVPFPPDWALLWELENYLDPVQPGEYLLNPAALRAAVRRGALSGVGDSPSLEKILESGLGEPLPSELRQKLAAEPLIRVIRGRVIEFSDPEDLKRVRRLPGLGRELTCLLSPRHVALDPLQEGNVLQRLCRLGLVFEPDLICEHQSGPLKAVGSDSLSTSERAYLLSLLLLVEKLPQAPSPPPGLAAKISSGVEPSLHSAAARKAGRVLEKMQPRQAWQPEEVPPPPPTEELLAFIQGVIDRGETLDVCYQTTGQHAVEERHLTPLLLEERLGRHYLIAYCHLRCANRTFRVDRLSLVQV